MTARTAEAIQKQKEIKTVVSLIAQIRIRLDNGHYDFMSWSGRSRLGTKLNEYETYLTEPHKSRQASQISAQKKTLKEMEIELRALLGSTY